MKRRLLLSIFPFSLLAGNAKAKTNTGRSLPAVGAWNNHGVENKDYLRPGEIRFCPKELQFQVQDGDSRPFLRGVIEYRTADGKALRWAAVESPKYDKKDLVSYRTALREFHAMVGLMISQEFYPEHTPFGEFEWDAEAGMMVPGKNPHYRTADGVKTDIAGNPL